MQLIFFIIYLVYTVDPQLKYLDNQKKYEKNESQNRI